MMLSTFGVTGSVKRRNFVPVNVWKQLRRKKFVSIVSMPEGRTEGSGVVVPEELVAEGRRGVRDLVIAWTLHTWSEQVDRVIQTG